jgi:hypothetical protein
MATSSGTSTRNRRTLDVHLLDDRREQALAAGRAKKWFSNWVSKALQTDADARDGIALLHETYDQLRAGGSNPIDGGTETSSTRKVWASCSIAVRSYT